jgi:hypothetical protein
MAQREVDERLPLELPLRNAVKVYVRRLGIFLLIVAVNLLLLGTVFWLPKLPIQVMVLLGIVVGLLSLITLLGKISTEKRNLIIVVASVSVFFLFVVVSVRNPPPYPFPPFLDSISLPIMLALLGSGFLLLSLLGVGGRIAIEIRPNRRYVIAVLGILMIVLAIVMTWFQAK